MIKVVDVVYHYNKEYNNPQALLNMQKNAFGFADFVNPALEMYFVKHLNYTGFEKIKRSKYAFFKSRNHFWWIPFSTHRYIKKLKPDIMIIEGLLFPLQLLFLKLSSGKKCRFIVRHHGEKPFKGIKLFFQKLADNYIDAYLFTSYKNAAGWVGTVIKDQQKCIEVLEASTYFNRSNMQPFPITGVYNFLWVGRLIADKDPFTVLKAFEKYAWLQPDAKLYMIYQEENLLEDVEKIIATSNTLKQCVQLVGKIDNNDLAAWYSAANFFISGSRREAAGYAMLEAMACGCIPLVTDIPSFIKITANGKYGFLYPQGDIEALTALLSSLTSINTDTERAVIETYFNEQLSFKKIADDISKLCIQLHSV